MSEHKILGRIASARFGFGGYQDAMFGLDITIQWPGGGVSAPFIGGWAPSLIEHSERSAWTEADRRLAITTAALKLERLLHAAKKAHVGELAGVPVECTFDGAGGPHENTLVSWRVLEEVL